MRFFVTTAVFAMSVWEILCRTILSLIGGALWAVVAVGVTRLFTAAPSILTTVLCLTFFVMVRRYWVRL